MGILWAASGLGAHADAVFRCPGPSCASLFLARYARGDGRDQAFSLQGVAPWKPGRERFPNEVGALSPRFVEVHRATTAAEAAGLTDLVGMRLRKALEFLIKDYALGTKPDEAEKIKAMPLEAVIREYCKDERLQKAARRATWLGNDETHYARIWEDKDIEDLKVLVRLTVGWVEAEVLTQKHAGDMPEGRRPGRP